MLSWRPPYSHRQASWLPVLGYHRVLPDGLDSGHGGLCVTTTRLTAQMRWFARLGFRTIALDTVAHLLDNGLPVPPRRFVITFDDGYLDTLTYAVPVLERFGFTATVFVVPGLVGGTNSWDRGRFAPAELMRWDQLAGLRRRGFSIGSHTMSHVSLTRLQPDEVWWELSASRRTLQERLDIEVRAFCYPWGDWAPWVAELVSTAGYSLACDDVGRTSNARFVMARTDPTYWWPWLTPLVRSHRWYFRVQRSPALRQVVAAVRRSA